MRSLGCSLLCALLFLLTCAFPPLSGFIHHYWVQYWPPATVFHLQQTMSGGQISLLVTEACRSGIFDAIHAIGCAQQETFDEEAQTRNFLWAWFETNRAECVTPEQIFSHRGKGQTLTDVEPNNQKSEHFFSTPVRDQQSRLRRLSSWLNMLAAEGFLDPCISQNDHTGFSLPRHTLNHLVKVHFKPSSSSSVEGRKNTCISTDNPEYLCGLGIMGNHLEVLNSLLNLNRNVFDVEEIATTKTSPVKSDVWKEYSTQTRDDFITKRVANSFGKWVLELLSTHSEQTDLVIGDVGCGSGTYLRELRRLFLEQKDTTSLPSCAVLVPFDLPEVVQLNQKFWETEFGNTTISANSLPGLRDKKILLRPLGGSLDNEKDLRALAHTFDLIPSSSTNVLRIVLFSSVLQHLSDVEVLSSLQRVHEIVKPNFIFIVEISVPSPELPYNRWTELFPIGRVFDPVISSFTANGRVRSAQEYAEFGRAAGATEVEQRGVDKLGLIPVTITKLSFPLRS